MTVFERTMAKVYDTVGYLTLGLVLAFFAAVMLGVF